MKKRKHKFPPEGHIGIVVFFPPEFHDAIAEEVFYDKRNHIETNKAEAIARYAMIGYHSEKMKQS